MGCCRSCATKGICFAAQDREFLESGVETGFLLDQIVEHVAVDIAVGANKMPGGLGVGDAEVFLFPELELSEFDGVGVAGVQDDLDDIDFGAAADTELEAVFEIYESVGTEKGQGGNAELLGDYLGNHCLNSPF